MWTFGLRLPRRSVSRSRSSSLKGQGVTLARKSFLLLVGLTTSETIRRRMQMAARASQSSSAYGQGADITLAGSDVGISGSGARGASDATEPREITPVASHAPGVQAGQVVGA